MNYPQRYVRTVEVAVVAVSAVVGFARGGALRALQGLKHRTWRSEGGTLYFSKGANSNSGRGSRDRRQIKSRLEKYHGK